MERGKLYPGIDQTDPIPQFVALIRRLGLSLGLWLTFQTVDEGGQTIAKFVGVVIIRKSWGDEVKMTIGPICGDIDNFTTIGFLDE
jgi:hypothetical protein